MIIASRDEKRCNASVHCTRLVDPSSLRFVDQHRKCLGWLLFFAVPALQPDRSCRGTSTYTKTATGKTVATSSFGNNLLKTRWFCRRWRVETSLNHTLTSLCFFLFWPMDYCERLVPSRRTLRVLRSSISPTPESFHSSFQRSLKCFAQPGDHHSCQARNTGSALKK